MALMVGSSGGGSGGICIPRNFSAYCTFSKTWDGSGTPSPEDLDTALDVTGPGRLLCVYGGTKRNGGGYNVIIEYDGHRLTVLNANLDAFNSNLSSTKRIWGVQGTIIKPIGDGFMSTMDNGGPAYIPDGLDDILDSGSIATSSNYPRFVLPDGLFFEDYLKVYAAFKTASDTLSNTEFIVAYELFEPI